MGGAIFETAVIMEVFKTLVHRGRDPQLYFWRTAGGQEVDLVVEAGGQLIPIEIKLTATPHPGMVAGIAAFRTDLEVRVGPGWLVHTGDTALPLGAGVQSVPFADL
jgi:predicted AAA+ superfamily ATPase